MQEMFGRKLIEGVARNVSSMIDNVLLNSDFAPQAFSLMTNRGLCINEIKVRGSQVKM